MNRTTSTGRRYQKELGLALLLYVALLVGSLVLSSDMAPGVPRTALLLSPMLAFGLAMRAIVRLMRDTDEFLRKTMLEQLAVAAAGTAGITFTYGFLEVAGFPKLSMFMVWPLMGALWVAASVVHWVRNR
jgi:peptidoglycan/LPS O-acetylase OafA/YrhL